MCPSKHEFKVCPSKHEYKVCPSKHGGKEELVEREKVKEKWSGVKG